MEFSGKCRSTEFEKVLNKVKNEDTSRLFRRRNAARKKYLKTKKTEYLYAFQEAEDNNLMSEKE